MGITHNFVSSKDQGGDSSLVSKNEWNADHVITGLFPGGARYPVQEIASGNANTSTPAATWGSTPTEGNILLMVVAEEGAVNVSSITQTNVTWTKLAESTASTAPKCEIWKGVVGASASTSCTVNLSGSSWGGWVAQEWSDLTGTLDQSAVITNSSRRYIPIITPTDANALVITGGSNNGYAYDFNGYDGAMLFRSAIQASNMYYAIAFGFPGIVPVMGLWSNSHGGTFSGVTISIT